MEVPIMLCKFRHCHVPTLTNNNPLTHELSMVNVTPSPHHAYCSVPNTMTTSYSFFWLWVTIILFSYHLVTSQWNNPPNIYTTIQYRSRRGAALQVTVTTWYLGEQPLPTQMNHLIYGVGYFLSVMDNHAPLKTKPIKQPDWLTPGVMQVIKPCGQYHKLGKISPFQKQRNKVKYNIVRVKKNH